MSRDMPAWATAPVQALLTDGQLDALRQFEALTGFEPMGLHDLESGLSTPEEVWKSNFDWFEGLHADVCQIQFPGDDDPKGRSAE